MSYQTLIGSCPVCKGGPVVIDDSEVICKHCGHKPHIIIDEQRKSASEILIERAIREHEAKHHSSIKNVFRNFLIFFKA